MKNLNYELTSDNFNEFILSNEEMIYIRGAGDPVSLPSPPPIKI